MHIRLLGGFEVSVGTRTIVESEWRLRKASGLIKLLALAEKHRLHRERIMDLLWPDLGLEAAANNLHQALHAARRTLEPNTTGSRYLRLRDELLVLCPDDPLLVDVEVFLDTAAKARRSREPATYKAAIELYAGDLLPGDPYESWVQERREELRSTYLSLLLELARLCKERKEFGPAIEALQRTVSSEPTHEEAHASLMRLYAGTGQRHRALRQYEHLRQALRRELGAEPDAASRRLYEEILAGHVPTAGSPPGASPPSEPPDAGGRHNLPISLTSFIGRERALAEVKRLLGTARLLTLTGAGGAGKTRLALAVAGELAGAYPDGAWLAELAPLSEGELVPQVVAGALGVREQPGRPLTDALVDALREQKVLLVLDNCEHLVDTCAPLAETLLGSCPGLRILATSRETLGAAGEVAWLVPSLSGPDPQRQPTVEDLAGCESVRLFVERARNRNPAFVLTPQNAEAVAQICERLDGIPLTIELAAARPVLTAEQIAARLDDSLRLLSAGRRTAPPRQRTLRGALNWSYDLLSEPERRLFGRLSAFAGGWTLEAAEAVGPGSGIEEEDILDLLSRLVDKSLVVAESGSEGVPRYRMLEPIRQYGREHLEESGEADGVRCRHAAFFLALAEEAEPGLKESGQGKWLKQLELEHDNLRAALSWTLERGEAELGLRLAGALGEFWRIRGHLREGLRWVEATLANGENASPTRVKALAHAGWMAWHRLGFERSAAFSEEALKLSRKLGDKAGAATALYNLGMDAVYDQMRSEEAWALFEEALALRRELGDTAGAGRTLQKMGLISVVRHDFERAQALYEESLKLARETDDRVGVDYALWLGALAALGRGEHERVRALCGEGLDLARQIGHTHGVALILHVLAASFGTQGRAVPSARLWGAAESLLDTSGRALGPAERHFYGPYIASARSRLGDTAWEEAWSEGRAMTPERAIEYALLEKEEPRTTAPKKPPVGKQPVTLTRREWEIAALVARGLSNRRIASELVIFRADGRQPRQQDPQEARARLPGPDRQLGNRTTAARNRPRLREIGPRLLADPHPLTWGGSVEGTPRPSQEYASSPKIGRNTHTGRPPIKSQIRAAGYDDYVMNVPSGEISSLEPAQRAVREAAGRVIGGFGAEALDDFRSAIAPRQRIEEPSAGDGRSPTQGRASSPPSPARLLIVDDHPWSGRGCGPCWPENRTWRS